MKRKQNNSALASSDSRALSFMFICLLQTMVEHPAEIIRFGKSIVPAAVVYTGIFLISNFDVVFLQSLVSISRIIGRDNIVY